MLQIPLEKVFRHPKRTPKPLAEGSREHKGYWGGIWELQWISYSPPPFNGDWKRGTSTSTENFSRSLMMTISQTTTTVSASRTLRCFGTFIFCVLHDYYGKHRLFFWQLGQVSGVQLIENLTAIWVMLQIRVDKISRHKSHSGSLAFRVCISMLLESKALGFYVS